MSPLDPQVGDVLEKCLRQLEEMKKQLGAKVRFGHSF